MSEAEERERAHVASKKLAALGYVLRIGATNSYVRDAGGNVVGEFAYVVQRVNGMYASTELIGNLLAVEGFAWTAGNEEAEKQAALKRLREHPPAPMIQMGDVIAVPYGEDFPSQAELDKRRMRAEILAELREEINR